MFKHSIKDKYEENYNQEDIMKKLLCVLMLGMVFSQEKLETRMYMFPVGESNIIEFNLSELTDGELSNTHEAVITTFGLSSFGEYLGDDYIEFKIKYYSLDSGYEMEIDEQLICGIFPNPDLSSSAYLLNMFPVNYTPGLGHQFLIEGDNFVGEIKFAITADYPDDDVGLQGDMNDDEILDILDIVLMVNTILDGEQSFNMLDTIDSFSRI